MATKTKKATVKKPPATKAAVDLSTLRLKQRGGAGQSIYSGLFADALKLGVGKGLPIDLKGEEPKVVLNRIATALIRFKLRKGEGWVLRATLVLDKDGNPSGVVIGKFPETAKPKK